MVGGCALFEAGAEADFHRQARGYQMIPQAGMRLPHGALEIVASIGGPRDSWSSVSGAPFREWRCFQRTWVQASDCYPGDSFSLPTLIRPIRRPPDRLH
jgi:hypothetical protein